MSFLYLVISEWWVVSFVMLNSFQHLHNFKLLLDTIFYRKSLAFQETQAGSKWHDAFKLSTPLKKIPYLAIACTEWQRQTGGWVIFLLKNCIEATLRLIISYLKFQNWQFKFLIQKVVLLKLSATLEKIPYLAIACTEWRDSSSKQKGLLCRNDKGKPVAEWFFFWKIVSKPH